MKKRVAIVGGGFTGLTAASSLVGHDIEVVIFESTNTCGGLAAGFNTGEYSWDLEVFYHHVFTNDEDIYELAKKVDWPVVEKQPVSSSFLHLKESRLDSPTSLLKFSGISLAGRVRMGIGLLLLKLIPNGTFLERWRAVDLLPKMIGPEGYKVIWKKLLDAKFGPYVNEVNMAWFWARVAKRTKRLGYFDKGFSGLIRKILQYITNKGATIRLNTKVNSIKKAPNGVLVNDELFDAVLVTTPAPRAMELIKGLKFPKIDYLWGQTLILELSKKLFKSYWMNILEPNWPFLVAVEHTNFVDKKMYSGNVIVYLGNYLPTDHKQLGMNKEQILKLYTPYLKKLNKSFKNSWVSKAHLFREPYAQPVFPINFSKKIPRMETNAQGIYVANMSMVYPYDRGTNYAVKMGREAAEKIMDYLKNDA